jgi:hypothetical protein
MLFLIFQICKFYGFQDLELSLRKSESEKQSRDHNIRSLQEEMANQDELVAKLNKEKKHQEEVILVISAITVIAFL